MWKFFILLILCGHLLALSDDEAKAIFAKFIMKCTKEHPVEMTELFQLQKLVVPKKKETKCLLACAYKSEGSMTAKGMYDTAHAYKIAEQVTMGDENRMENAKKLVDICVKINDMPVSDGEKGCDRAALLFKCVVDNGPKLGFKL